MGTHNDWCVTTPSEFLEGSRAGTIIHTPMTHCDSLVDYEFTQVYRRLFTHGASSVHLVTRPTDYVEIPVYVTFRIGDSVEAEVCRELSTGPMPGPLQSVPTQYTSERLDC